MELPHRASRSCTFRPRITRPIRPPWDSPPRHCQAHNTIHTNNCRGSTQKARSNPFARAIRIPSQDGSNLRVEQLAARPFARRCSCESCYLLFAEELTVVSNTAMLLLYCGLNSPTAPSSRCAAAFSHLTSGYAAALSPPYWALSGTQKAKLKSKGGRRRNQRSGFISTSPGQRSPS